MKNESLREPVKKVEPPRDYTPRVPLFLAASLIGGACITLPVSDSNDRPPILGRAYLFGINLIDKHLKIKNSKLGKKVRDGLVDLATGYVGSALGSRSTPRPDSRLARRDDAVMVSGVCNSRNIPDVSYDCSDVFQYLYGSKVSE
jgi:hypothetical protein